MAAFSTILKNDLKIILKDIKALLLILFMPLLIIVLFSQALAPLLNYNTFVEPFSLVLVEEEKSSWTNLLATQLKNMGIVDRVYYSDEEEARELIKNQSAAAAIVLPKDLVSSIDHWEPIDGKIIGSELQYLESKLVKNIGLVGSTAVSAGLAALNVIFDVQFEAGFTSEELHQEIVDANEAYIMQVLNRKVFINEKKFDKPDVNPVVYYALSLLSVFILFASIPCMKLLTEERRLGILTRLNAAPTRSWQTVLSKLIVSLLISITQFAIIFILIVRVGGKELLSALGPMIPVLIATILAAGAFSLFVASLAGSGSLADLIANLSILLMAVMGGSLFPLASLPDYCRPVSLLTINRWATEGFLNALYGESINAVYASCGPLLLIAAGYFLISALILSAQRRRVSS
jgi:ABC-2 type transport system permease protein